MRTKMIEISSAAFIFLFVYAAASKLMDYDQFVMQIGQSPMLTSFASIIAWAIPAIEVVISLLLFLPVTRLLGLYSFFGLMALFTGYIILASRFSDYVPCSCGGVIGDLNWTEHLIFNIVFLIGALINILLYSSASATGTTESVN